MFLKILDNKIDSTKTRLRRISFRFTIIKNPLPQQWWFFKNYILSCPLQKITHAGKSPSIGWGIHPLFQEFIEASPPVPSGNCKFTYDPPLFHDPLFLVQILEIWAMTPSAPSLLNFQPLLPWGGGEICPMSIRRGEYSKKIIVSGPPLRVFGGKI